MAFLDNAGDIILDAVLTDAGRQRLARGNFKIVKFAFGDEEINYGLYNSNHPSGSAFYDLEIMQTPILEAFTNNTSLMKSKLVSINRNNILYMPVLKTNKRSSAKCQMRSDYDGYYLTADSKTANLNGATGLQNVQPGIMHGALNSQNAGNTLWICTDQGIVTDGNTDGLSIKDRMPPDMIETAFLVKVDHRLLTLYPAINENGNTGTRAVNQFVDDDAVATYFFAQGDGTRTVYTADFAGQSRGLNVGRTFYFNGDPDDADVTTRSEDYEMFSGPIGNFLRIVPKVAASVQNSSTLFDKIGTTGKTTLKTHTDAAAVAIGKWKYIDTSVNITGVTTGYSVDVPIRIIKVTDFT